MKDLPRAAQGSTVVLDAEVYNAIVDTLRRLDSWSVAPPLHLLRDAAGNHLCTKGVAEQVLVGIIGVETGGGRYKGTILSGGSTGSTSTNFQLRSSLTQSATDGPVPQLQSGNFVNNALVVNVLEQYVGNSHMLWAPTGQTSPPSDWGAFFAFGRVMGQTSENPSRTIVYIEGWPMAPVWAKITTQGGGGTYTGRIFPGHIADYMTDAGPIYSTSSGATTIIESNLPSVDNCWINNAWEQRAGLGTCQLPVGVYVPAYVVGFTDQNQVGDSTTPWYAVWTMTPPYASAIADVIESPSSAGYVAGSDPVESPQTFGVYEIRMMNAMQADIQNLYASLNNLYDNLRGAGYIGQSPAA
jgi:hypothetical protein